MSYSRIVMADSPAAYWPLGDLSGTTDRDRSGNGRNLTWGSAPTPSNVLGEFGGVSLAGDREASIASAAWMDGQTFSVEFWCQTTSTTAGLTAPITRRATNDAFGIYMDLPTNGIRGLIRRAGPASVLSQPSPAKQINDGAIHHVWYMWTGASVVVELWVDGVRLTNSGSSGTAYTPQSEPLRVGGENASRFWTGKIGHVACYTSSPTTAMIETHYEAGLRAGLVSG